MSVILPPLTHQHPYTHRLAPDWPKGILRSFVLPGGIRAVWSRARDSRPSRSLLKTAVTLCEHPFSLKLYSFEVLGQDFLIFGSLAKATAVTPLHQMCENPKAIAKVFIFHPDKICRRKKLAHVRKHRCLKSLTCSAEPLSQISSPDGHQTG